MSKISNTTALLATINPIAAVYNHYGASSSPFVNVQEEEKTGFSVGIIILLIIIFAILFFSCKAVYNLTDSVLQTILFFIFGFVYLYFAILYYGLSGYKFKLANSGLNSKH